MLQQLSLFKFRIDRKTKPTLKKIKDGKNCYEKEKLPLTQISGNSNIMFFLK